MNKVLKLSFLVGLFLFAISCRGTDTDRNISNNGHSISFNITEGGFDMDYQASVNSNFRNAVINREEKINSGPFSITSGFSPFISKIHYSSVLSSSTSKASVFSLGVNVKYRVIVYRQDGTYLGQEVGNVSDKGQKFFANLNLVGGQRYTFVTYSLNTTADPPVVPTDNLDSAVLNLNGLDGKESGTDLMYAINENVLLSGGNTVLDVVLKHQFSRISISVENTDAKGTPGQPDYIKGSYALNNNTTGGFTGKINNFYSSTKISLKNGSVTGTNSGEASIPGISTTAQTFIINTGGETAYKTTITIPVGAIAIGKDVNRSPVNISIDGPAKAGLEPGRFYTLKLKFNSDRYTDVNGNTVTKGTGIYAVIGGYKWARYNEGVANKNPTVNNPDVLRKEVHGSYYQWGYQFTVADADTYDGSISNWNRTNNTNNKGWNNGTEDRPIKTSNDPCVGGFRVPTHSDLRTLINNTVQNDVGSFETSAANYGAAKVFRSKKAPEIQLTFPNAGFRESTNGSLRYRGYGGYYWASSSYASNFMSSETGILMDKALYGSFGNSVRCIAE
ncbi:hypothetical protein I6H88_17160 [Elizabethkingia bruuniana]|uniref:Fibrobacter succinogenes major paralogous domain-containing protein n=1 Tax=Elizabethkingia bruuniana TaxID=1756149 RepID=A0A7T7UY17_9FLAO|nr:hypothetical protein [Elizabethkingia bruuniana]AQX84667.1 hypothetical protein AYC65_06470 [Elizabethkingia bruuniana]KUY29150.1 hypothetical protein ATB97_03200 [Elizabethkingia bruuniana]OPB70775.1 hypothetical protein BAY12_19310 [Elizabethkingia bruuniana]QQN58139.1 hypothetical protein I6H88_17160 [Elizabethkingia bruuniana]